MARRGGALWNNYSIIFFEGEGYISHFWGEKYTCNPESNKGKLFIVSPEYMLTRDISPAIPDPVYDEFWSEGWHMAILMFAAEKTKW